MKLLLARIEISEHDLFPSHGRVDQACKELLCAVRSALVGDIEVGRGSSLE